MLLPYGDAAGFLPFGWFPSSLIIVIVIISRPVAISVATACYTYQYSQSMATSVGMMEMTYL